MEPSSTWMSRLWSRIKGGVIQDVPPSLEACESCREADCSQERWLSCARRLATEAECCGVSDRCLPSPTGRTDEMPGLITEDSPQAQPAEAEIPECCVQRKRASSSGD